MLPKYRLYAGNLINMPLQFDDNLVELKCYQVLYNLWFSVHKLYKNCLAGFVYGNFLICDVFLVSLMKCSSHLSDNSGNVFV